MIRTRISKLGPAQSEYTDCPGDYFRARSEIWTKPQNAPFLDAAGRILSSLAQALRLDLQVAQDAEHGAYAPCIVQSMRGETLALHFDYAPVDAAGWTIDRIKYQLAWNVYLVAPPQGGECAVYRRAWSPEDAQEQTQGYAHDPSKVAAVPRILHKIGLGDLVLFDSRNYHRVLATPGPRLSIGGFIGRNTDGTWSAWA